MLHGACMHATSKLHVGKRRKKRGVEASAKYIIYVRVVEAKDFGLKLFIGPNYN